MEYYYPFDRFTNSCSHFDIMRFKHSLYFTFRARCYVMFPHRCLFSLLCIFLFLRFCRFKWVNFNQAIKCMKIVARTFLRRSDWTVNKLSECECEHQKWYLFLNFTIQKHYYYVSRFIIAQPFNFIVKMQTNISPTFLMYSLTRSSVFIFISSLSLLWISFGWKVFHCSQFDTVGYIIMFKWQNVVGRQCEKARRVRYLFY